MISCLQHTFGVTDQALNWFVSYFDARSMFVRRSGTSSAATACNYGVPQGSSLGPMCITLPLCHMWSALLACGIINMQITPRCTLQPQRTTWRWTSTDSKSVHVHQWLLHNGLQLNPSKSEAILFTTGRGRQSVDDAPSLQVSDAVIQPSDTIKNLGVTLDRHLTLDQHCDRCV